MTAEHVRLEEVRRDDNRWRYWGPYPSDQRSGQFRDNGWGEDGLAAICDDQQRLCFAITLWNGHTSILKECLFGEHVEEYFYLDNTPTHSYMKYLYKHPQHLNHDEYIEVVIEYAKAGPDDILIRVSVTNRGDESAHVRLLPTLWFRNTWGSRGVKPMLKPVCRSPEFRVVSASHPELTLSYLYTEGLPDLLFPDRQADVSNPPHTGTMMAFDYNLVVAVEATQTVRLRLMPHVSLEPFGDFERVFSDRIAEADAFYDSITPSTATEDRRRSMRQAMAGMFWSKQYRYFDLKKWLRKQGHSSSNGSVQNESWFQMLKGLH